MILQHRQGTSYRMGIGDFHRITTLEGRPTTTLVIMGQKAGSWGFLVDGYKVDYRSYLDGLGLPE
jgi:hypothetical protein